MRVATWNLENLFRPDDEFGPDSQQAYEAKLRALAATITDMAPDVLGVQEVGSVEAFNDLVDRLGDGWTSHLAAPGDARHPIRVGVLTRHALGKGEDLGDYLEVLPAVQVDDDGNTTGKLSRPNLHVQVTTDDGVLDVVVCHFKSKLLSFPHGFSPDNEDQRARFATYALGRRAAEAATTRGLANRLLGGQGQQRPLLVMGDLNDTEYSATTSLLQGPGGSEIGTGGFHQPDGGDAHRLWNLGLAIPIERRFSRTYRGRGELIDHSFASHALVQGELTVDSVDIDAGDVGDVPGDRTGGPASDHRPIVADLSMPLVP